MTDQEVHGMRVKIDLTAVGRAPFSLELDLRHFSHQIIYQETQSTGFHEKETSHLMCALVKEGDMVIDVGAHVGYFSLLASRLAGPTGKVFAFEPIEENVARLRNHIRINEADNITVISKVVGDVVGSTPFYYNRDNDGGHALWDVGEHPFNRRSKEAPLTISLPITTLDEQFAGMDLGRLKMIKIDAEGNEFNVLKGAHSILERQRVKCISWELNPFALGKMGHTEDALRGHMREMGYETMAFVDGKLTPLSPAQHLRADFVINLFFMPVEFVGARG